MFQAIDCAPTNMEYAIFRDNVMGNAGFTFGPLGVILKKFTSPCISVDLYTGLYSLPVQ